MFEIKQEGKWFVVYFNGQWTDQVRTKRAAEKIVAEYKKRRRR